jgi:hypothetical protein
VPTEIIKDDLTFYDYIFNSNERWEFNEIAMKSYTSTWAVFRF